jgi:hypothetical protein
MAMRTRKIIVSLSALGLASFACTFPGATPPTPIVFPTPNQTLTAIFAPTQEATLAPPPTSESLPTIAVTPADTLVTPATVTPGAQLGRPNGTPVEAAFLTIPPTIDGDLGDWSSSAYSATQMVYGASRWEGLADASAVFYVGWDDSRLYLAARVTDDHYVQVSKGASLYLGDSIEIQVDANLTADFYTASLDGDDYQIGFSAGNFGSIAPEAYRWYPTSKRGIPDGAVVAGKSTSNGYTLEASIPWSSFGITAADGNRYGLAVSVSDDDSPGTASQQSMVSSVSTRKLLNPTTWGTLILQGPSGGS